MDDLISRQAAIEAMRTCYDTEREEFTNGDEFISYDQAVRELESLPSVSDDGWIPCSERLPETNVRHTCFGMGEWYSSEVVLVYCEKMDEEYESNIIMASYDRDMGDPEMRYGWSECASGYEIKPVAWMPLPKPYQPKEDGK